MKTIPYTEIDENDQKLLSITSKRTSRSLNKVTNPQVAATVVTSSGLYYGNNVFLSNCTLYCAEVAAILAAVAAGDIDIRKIYIAIRRADGSKPGLVTPCGNCRQVIVDFSIKNNRNIVLMSTNDELKEVLVTDSDELIPGAYVSVSLSKLGRIGEA